MSRRLVSLLLSIATAISMMFAAAPGALGQEKIDAEANARIRKEGMENSQIMRTMHFLTDVYGPRLTGSPSLKAAGEWAIKQMKLWGLENGHLEPWDFGHPGWVNERLTAHIVSPVKDSLVCEVLAWTPGTNGVLTAQVFQISPAERPTKEELTAYLDTVKDRVKGKIVLAGKRTIVAVTMDPRPKRQDDQQARERYDPNNPNAGQFGRRQREQEQQQPGRLTANEVNEQIDQFLLSNGALLRVNDAGRDHGQIRAFNNRTFDLTKALPTVVMRNEDYGRISRLLDDGVPVELEFSIVNRVFPEGKTAYNTVAEIPGTDRKDEVIMLGGHLDSWHSATGATDNAIGCAVMVEAARILKAIGVKPRRTIRVALWSGEEEGLLGSKAYVAAHFGSFENPKPEFEKLGGYFNIDSGTGRARGAAAFGPPEAATVLREVLKPFEDLGVMGAIATKGRVAGGSDNGSFNLAGLPGIGIGQDPIEYNTYTWHTNLDTYERIVEDDAKKSAIVIAAAVYHLAMRDALLPRFSKEQMPAVPPSQQQPASPQPQTPPAERSN
ncbi:MAG TPA: M20/M25/M40 family metallo-hydrolase [Blastocatellia bacterium]|nr:M20/M25/M40 family metallo-hydrolase [Blastocatellia bacterium]